MKKKLKHFINKLQFRSFCKRYRKHLLKSVRIRCNIIYECIDILLCGNEFIDDERLIMIKALEMYKEQIKELNDHTNLVECRLNIATNSDMEKDKTPKSE